MPYSWPFFNSHGHMFLNSTGRRWAMKQARRKTITQSEKLPSLFLSALIGSPSIFLLLLDSSLHFFTTFRNSQFHLLRCQYCQQDLFLVLVKAAVSLCTLHEYQFTHNLHWDSFPPRGNRHRGQESHLLIGSINFCCLQKGKSQSSQCSKIPENPTSLQHLHNPSQCAPHFPVHIWDVTLKAFLWHTSCCLTVTAGI